MKVIKYVLTFLILFIGGCSTPIIDEKICQEGETLINGECVLDNPVIECGDNQELVDGVCVDKPITCLDNQDLIDGVCVDKPVTCLDNQTLVDGVCVDIIEECPEGEVYLHDKCMKKSVITETFTLKEVVNDFERAVLLLDQLNPKLFTDQEHVNSVISAQRKLLKDNMTLLEFFRVLTPVVASYDCGHTRLVLSNPINGYYYEYLKVFPLATKVINGELYAYGNANIYNIKTGSKIISINDKPVKEIFDQIVAGYSSDGINSTMAYRVLNEHFGYFLYLFCFEFTDRYKIVYEEYGTNKTMTKTINGNYWYKIFDDSSWEYTPLIASYYDDYAVLKITSFNPDMGYSLEDYYTFFKEFFEKVSENKIESVILDLRGNGGGDPRITSNLFSYLAKYEQPYFDSDAPNSYYGLTDTVYRSEPHYDKDIYTLIDGVSFSSTGHLLALMKYQNIGYFIGEESGGSYACSDSSSNHLLSNTGIILQTSEEIWKVKVENIDHGHGIIPDSKVSMTIEDYIAKKDIIMDYTVAMIKSKDIV